MQSQRKRQRNWSFTLNNYTDEELQIIESYLSPRAKYFILGKEVGSQGTPHIQGYCSLKEKLDFSILKNNLPSRTHIEASRGTAHDNRTYCSKEGNYTEHGDCPSGDTKKKTRDILALELRNELQQGRAGITRFADENPGTFAWSGHVLLRNALGLSGAQPRPDINVKWIFGPPGLGKSKYAHEQLPNAYIKEPRTKWWNGYLLEREVIIDDFGPKGIDINHLLRWFDRYKCYVEIKGDMCPLLADKFIVTSNFPPQEIFRLDNGDLHPQVPALRRRIQLYNMHTKDEMQFLF